MPRPINEPAGGSLEKCPLLSILGPPILWANGSSHFWILSFISKNDSTKSTI